MTDFAIRGGALLQRLGPFHSKENEKAPEEWTVKTSSRLLSGRELVMKMGAAPKADITIFGRTIKTNSAAYRNALGSLPKYQKTLESYGGVAPATLESSGHLAALRSLLQDVVVQADAYDAKHANDNSNSKEERRSVMSELKSMAQKELAALDDALSLDDGKTDLKILIALARGGVHDPSSVNFDLSGDKIQNTNHAFGSGKISTVALLDYGADGQRVVKPLYKGAPSGDMATGAVAIGFDREDMLVGARNIASAKLAELLGVGHLGARSPGSVGALPHFLGLPPLMSASMYEKLKTVDEKDIRGALEGLPEDVIEAACERHEGIKKHAADLKKDGRVVDDFKSWMKLLDEKMIVTASDYLTMSDNAKNNYVARGAADAADSRREPNLVSARLLDPSKHKP